MQADWVAVDWGTSSLRAWAMDSAGAVLDMATAEDGMGGLEPNAFEPALLSLIDGWLVRDTQTLVLACGMVGARQGWVEAAYSETPCPPLATGNLTRAPAQDPRLDVRIVPGLCQTAPPDVMRGEETQIAGLLSQHSGFEGTICLPGTHTKWAEISEGLVQSFRTAMTGELFALLSDSSILRHSLDEDGTFDEEAFAAAVSGTLDNPAALAGELFGIRAASLLTGQSPAKARATLSGLLIGSEVAGLQRSHSPVLVIGADRLADHYKTALALAGRKADAIPADAITLNGLRQAYAALKEQP